jgi:hypothetical protein
MSKLLPHLSASLALTTIVGSENTQDHSLTERQAQAAHCLTCPTYLASATKGTVKDTQDHTKVNSAARPAHYQAGQDAYTALTNFAEFIGNNLRDDRKPVFPEHKKICQDSLVDASVAEDISVIEDHLSQFDKGLVELDTDLKRKNWRPDLSVPDNLRLDDLYYEVDYRRAKFGALALNPDGCTELLKVDDTSIDGYKRRSTLRDTVHHPFS